MRVRGVVMGAALGAGAATVVARRRRETVARLLAELDALDLAAATEDLAGEERWLATADGAKLLVHVTGPADGPTVVLAHCWGGSQQTWAPVARRLVAAGCRVVRWDQRGHGRSAVGDLGHTVEGLAHDLATVLTELDLRDVVLAGHSMGGFTVQGLAVHHRDVLDERARAMVLVATASHGLGDSPLALRPSLVAHRMVQQVFDNPAVGRAIVRGTFGRRAHPHHVDVTRADFAGTDGAVRAAFVEAFVAMDNRPGLADVSHPTTVVAGQLDTLTPLGLGRELAAAIPGAELQVLRGRGHMLPFEAADDVAAAILAHL